MLKWQWLAQVIFCAGGRYRAVKVSREQAISETEKSGGVGHDFQASYKQAWGPGSRSLMGQVGIMQV